jgi:hypothetical protein
VRYEHGSVTAEEGQVVTGTARSQSPSVERDHTPTTAVPLARRQYVEPIHPLTLEHMYIKRDV